MTHHALHGSHNCPSKAPLTSRTADKIWNATCQPAAVHVQGEQAHCGFPEANYHSNAERLARAGLRVVVVEQTETPDQLKIRNEGLKKAGKKQVNLCVDGIDQGHR